jgi:hypothetical protein
VSNYLVFVIWFFLLRKIFSKKIEKNNQQNQKNNDKPIPLVPGLKYGNFIVVIIHLNFKYKPQIPKESEKSFTGS